MRSWESERVWMQTCDCESNSFGVRGLMRTATLTFDFALVLEWADDESALCRVLMQSCTRGLVVNDDEIRGGDGCLDTLLVCSMHRGVGISGNDMVQIEARQTREMRNKDKQGGKAVVLRNTLLSLPIENTFAAASHSLSHLLRKFIDGRVQRRFVFPLACIESFGGCSPPTTSLVCSQVHSTPTCPGPNLKWSFSVLLQVEKPALPLDTCTNHSLSTPRALAELHSLR
mmetsp:Transcript_7009/g.26163  ORF Transcript_7009/g.26163 Transcript_7009/m.26163 type:complete len:229 (+) Transcript_7009:7367-8053(+)